MQWCWCPFVSLLGNFFESIYHSYSRGTTCMLLRFYLKQWLLLLQLFLFTRTVFASSVFIFITIIYYSLWLVLFTNCHIMMLTHRTIFSQDTLQIDYKVFRLIHIANRALFIHAWNNRGRVVARFFLSHPGIETT